MTDLSIERPSERFLYASSSPRTTRRSEYSGRVQVCSETMLLPGTGSVTCVAYGPTTSVSVTR